MGLGQAYDSWRRGSYKEIPPVVLASGPEAQLKTEFLEELETNFPDPEREIIKVYADEIEADELISELRSPGLFKSTTWLILKQMERKDGGRTGLEKHYEAIEDFLSTPEPNTHLIIEDADHPYKKGRKLGKLAASVESAGGWVIVFWEPFENSLRQRIRSRIEDAGVKIEPSALQRLLEKTKGKLARAQLEADKLIQFGQPNIGPEDVEAIISDESADDAYQELKAKISTGNLEEILIVLQDLLREGEDPYKIFSIIFSFLSKVRILQRERRRGRRLKEILGEMNIPTSKGIMTQYKQALKNITGRYPENFFRESYRTSCSIKYGSPEQAELILSRFLTRQYRYLRSY